MAQVRVFALPLLAWLTIWSTGCESKSAGRAQSAEPRASAPAAAAPSPTGQIRVEVGTEGFVPTHVALANGRGLVFRRTSDGTCATSVAFPELGLEKALPLNEDVPIELPRARRVS
jgi:plastocyanin domain-containing protein